MKTVKVIFADPKYNYKTDCSPLASHESIKKYFVGKFFDVGTYSDYKQSENIQECINIEIL